VPTLALAAKLRAELGSAFAGSTVAPGEAGYEGERLVRNATVDKHPDLIAFCQSPDDVASAIRAARSVGVPTFGARRRPSSGRARGVRRLSRQHPNNALMTMRESDLDVESTRFNVESYFRQAIVCRRL
jgi:hypothetical protein